MRELPLKSPPSLEKKNNDEVTQVRLYRLLTPLFGGGVKPGNADPVTVVRGTEVRGHLRFWWRATQGGRFNDDIQAMKTAEDALWGTASSNKEEPSSTRPVQLFVQPRERGEVDEPFSVERGKVRPNRKSDVPAYAAFALQPSSDDARRGGKSGIVRVGVSFTLEITFPAQSRNEVEAALWAWETFGGIGARTRRGFGALYCEQVSEDGKPQQVQRPSNCDRRSVGQWLQEQLQRYVEEGAWLESMPHLSHNMRFKVIDNAGDGTKSWQQLIDALQRFRQSREGNKYGPTHWPEPNAIRFEVLGRTSSKSPHIGKKFPRAIFGLPLIFHFPQRGEPGDATVKAKGYERMASPLILRPLSCDGRRAVGLAVVLDGPHLPPGDLVLVEEKGKTHLIDAQLNQREARLIKPLSGQTDVLQAFLDTL